MLLIRVIRGYDHVWVRTYLTEGAGFCSLGLG
jgi:hypothetical protein